MPTYEYACQSCGRHVEVFQKFSEDALTTCEVCGGPLRKVFHPAGILFKGSGFYATDHGKKAKPSGGEKKKDGDSGGSGSAGDSEDGANSKKESSSSDSSGSSTTTKKEGSS